MVSKVGLMTLVTMYEAKKSFAFTNHKDFKYIKFPSQLIQSFH